MEEHSSRLLFDLLLDLAFCQEDLIGLKRESSCRGGDTLGGEATCASAASESISPVPVPTGSRDRKASGRLSSPKQDRQRGQNPKPSPAQTDRSVPICSCGSVKGLVLLQRFRPSRAAQARWPQFPVAMEAQQERKDAKLPGQEPEVLRGSHRSCSSSAGALGFSRGQSQHEEPAGLGASSVVPAPLPLASTA